MGSRQCLIPLGISHFRDFWRLFGMGRFNGWFWSVIVHSIILNRVSFTVGSPDKARVRTEHNFETLHKPQRAWDNIDRYRLDIISDTHKSILCFPKRVGWPILDYDNHKQNSTISLVFTMRDMTTRLLLQSNLDPVFDPPSYESFPPWWPSVWRTRCISFWGCSSRSRTMKDSNGLGKNTPYEAFQLRHHHQLYLSGDGFSQMSSKTHVHFATSECGDD